MATYRAPDESYFSDVEVLEVFRGDLRTGQKVRLLTGGNTTAGGGPIQEEKEWIVVSSIIDAGVYSVHVCGFYSISQEFQAAEFPIALQILRDVKAKMAQLYSGDIAWKLMNMTIKGKMKKGQAVGTWTETNENGELALTTPYKAGKLHGKRRRWDRNLQLTEQYKMGQLVEAKWEELDQNRKIGAVLRTKKTVKTTPWGVLMEEKYYQNGVVTEQVTTYAQLAENKTWAHKDLTFYCQSARQRCKGQIYKGARVGEWEEWDDKANKMVQKNYPQPQSSTADFYAYHENGQLAVEGNLHNNLAHGTWTFYNWEGVVNRTVEYEAGLAHGKNQYFSDSRLNSVDMYSHGVLEGESFRYLENGQTQSKGMFKKGRKDGTVISYNQAGQIRKKETYSNGVLNGPYEEYDYETGKLLLKANCINGAFEGEGMRCVVRPRKCTCSRGVFSKGLQKGEWTAEGCD